MAKNFYGILVLVFLLVCTVSAQKSCLTPTGSQGRCVPFEKCTYVVQVRERYGEQIPEFFKNYTIKSWCKGGDDDLYICCNIRHFETGVNTTITSQTLNVSENYENNLNPRGLAVLNEQPCGDSEDPEVGYGQEAKLFEYPWMALLRFDSIVGGSTGPFRCMGSLITNRYVLTAGQCVRHTNNKLISVRLGDLDINTEKDCERGENSEICSEPAKDFGIEKMTLHPDFDTKTYANDVALIKLDKDVQFKRHIKPICLPITKDSAKLSKDTQFVKGCWDLTESTAFPNILKKVNVSYHELAVCQNIYKRQNLTDKQICAEGGDNGSLCNGDGGGPLFYKTPHDNLVKYVQFGITSLGVQRASDDTSPDVYTNVVQQMPWITSNID